MPAGFPGAIDVYPRFCRFLSDLTEGKVLFDIHTIEIEIEN